MQQPDRSFTNEQVILTTLGINTAIAALLLSSFFILCKPLLPIFNRKKQQRLLEAAKQEDLQLEIAETPSQLSVSSSFQSLLSTNFIKQIPHYQRQLQKEFTDQTKSYWHFFRDLIQTSLVNFWWSNTILRASMKWCKKYSPKVALYLLFQLHLFWALFFSSLLILIVLIPLHATGHIPPEYEEYKNSLLLKSTIAMTFDEPVRLYAHLILAVATMAIWIGFLVRYQNLCQRLFTVYGQYKTEVKMLHPSSTEAVSIYAPSATEGLSDFASESKVVPSHFTIELSGLPETFTSHIQLRYMVQQIFPSSSYHVVQSKLILDYSKRIEMQHELDDCNNSIIHYEMTNNLNKQQHYLNKKLEIESKIRQWENRLYKTLNEDASLTEEEKIPSSGKACVTFHSAKDVVAVLKKYKSSGIKYFGTYQFGRLEVPQHERVEDEISIERYNSYQETDYSVPISLNLKVKQAEETEDIIWENYSQHPNLARSSRHWIGLLILIILFAFFSTPTAVLSAFQSVTTKTLKEWGIGFPEWINQFGGTILLQYLPTFSLHILSLLIPSLIYQVTSWEQYNTRSKQSQILTTRHYSYLLIVIFVLPALVLSSLHGVILYLLEPSKLEKVLNNLYLPSSGVFFISFVLQAAILKNVGDLVNIDAIGTYLFTYFFYAKNHIGRRCVTAHEKLAAAKGHFGFPREVAYSMTLFSITMSLAFYTPIICIAGLLYQFIKIVFDRHSIRFVILRDEELSEASLSSNYTYLQAILRTAYFAIPCSSTVLLVFFSLRFASNQTIFLPQFLLSLALCLLSIFFYILLFFILPSWSNRSVGQSIRKIMQLPIEDSINSNHEENSWLTMDNLSSQQVFYILHAYEPKIQYLQEELFKKQNAENNIMASNV